MSAKKIIKEVQLKIIELKTPEFKINFQEKHHIAMLGWSQNFCEFQKGRVRGTVVLSGQTLGVSIDHLYKFSFDLEQLITFCLKERAKYKRGKK